MKNIVPRRGNTTYTAYSLFRQSVATNSNRPPLLLLCDNIGNVVANIIIGVVGMIANVIGNGLPMMLRLLVYWQQHWQPA